MEIDRYCNSCLGYYSYDIDETDTYEKCRWCGSEDTEEAWGWRYPNAIFSLDAYLEERVFNTKLIAPR